MTSQETAQKVLHDFGNREHVLETLYPHCTYHCETCDIPCEQNLVRKTYMKLLYSEAKANLGTENLEKELHS